ncbi:MAG: 50S ribosomal protein L6 [Gammaproteobacteria bacterium]|nr:50S ribosomal protein L6 [Gammaproteobacteria bacterium]MCH9744861.1 50S ribosomal protein L6 [Gammaproteobacteria bacterium]
MVSRVAKNPIDVPSGVEVKLSGQTVSIKGKNGELHQDVHPAVRALVEENQIKVAPVDEARESNALAGTMRALLNNMVKGVSEGFEKKLVMIGVGYRAKAQGKVLNLNVGFSHPVDVAMPEGVNVETPSNTEIVLKGANKQLVAQIAANIRDIRPPEPYKGKGIRYEGEHISLKEGKKK